MTQLESWSTRSGPGSAADPANERRRAVLAVLRAAATPLAMADLAADLVAREEGSAAEAPDYEAVQRCYVSLYHRHVPKLAAAGLVEFDADRRVVSLAG